MDLIYAFLVFVISTFLLLMYLTFGLVCFIFMMFFLVITMFAKIILSVSQWCHDQFQDSMLDVQKFADRFADKWK